MARVADIIAKAKDYYFNQWRGHEKISPAFGEKVYLTGVGWRHIAHHPRRLLIDKIIRLKNLGLAREVLETANTYQTINQKGKFILYGITAIKGNKRIKVVVSSKGKTGRKILFSVMFKGLNKRERQQILEQNEKLITDFRRKNPRIMPKLRRKWAGVSTF